ncbi:secretin N-terminal domain-containing protein [Opitutus sp. GAS368]|jgi:type II secretory pathway component GspD/PulD (secretin)|uniref:secretin N-terminal domain-containing protein n=1 Tax=Opitutus sp. GAS368 TaxID=1882749 RepID=UPI00087A6603|nr:secretin N-terminal domain-containing protein [Opitutus sp. GAS368]SDS11634.1 Type II secretory pathway component GspD/PulD (secretin) [Opitutus sp. GAS368]
MSTRTILTALFATALTLPVFAQSEPAPAAPAAPAATVAPAEAKPAEAKPAAPVVTAGATVEGSVPVATPASRDKDTLSVDFPDEDIKTILRNVADLFELNLVVPDTLTGKTSIKLRDVTWEQIFTVVLSPVGYTYVKEGNIIKIVSNELLQQEPGSTEVFILNNAKAADIKPTIDGLVDAAGGGKIVIDARSNALVITEKPSRMSRIRIVIDQLDKATDQVMIESKFVEVTDSDIRNIGVNWASLQGMKFGVGNIAESVGRNRNQNYSVGSNTNNSTTGNNGTTAATSAANTTTFVTTPNLPLRPGATNPGDVSPIFSTSTFNPQTGAVTGLPSALPANTGVANFTPFVAGTPGTPAILNNAGVVTSPAVPAVPDTQASFTAPTTFNGGNSTGSSSTNTINSAINALENISHAGSMSQVTTAVFSASDFNVIVSALKTQSNVKVMSNPTVVTLNNTEAVLNIGQEFPVPSYNYNSERGTFEVSGFAYKPIGIILKVTPQVNARGVIKLNLEPEVSQQNGSTTFGGAGGASIPIIATRKVKTQVSLKDGFTMGIGGLITDSRDHGGTKVPILGDIPLLGRLFSSKNVNDVSTNLLIFITAKTVTADGGAPEDVFDPRAISATGMTRDELPGYRAPKGTDVYAPAPVAPGKK